MKTLHPSTELPNKIQPWLPTPPVFPGATPMIDPDHLQDILELLPAGSMWLLYWHAVRAWEELGGHDLVGWVFTVDGLRFWAEMSEARSYMCISLHP